MDNENLKYEYRLKEMNEISEIKKISLEEIKEQEGMASPKEI
jgi:hypothetical protein